VTQTYPGAHGPAPRRLRPGDRHQIIRLDPLNDPTGAQARQVTCVGSCADDMDPAMSPTDAKIAYAEAGGPLVPLR
jgi:hypothetical protein